jgi:hypothetical protein
MLLITFSSSFSRFLLARLGKTHSLYSSSSAPKRVTIKEVHNTEGKDLNCDDELDLLRKEGEMPIEELRAQYAMQEKDNSEESVSLGDGEEEKEGWGDYSFDISEDNNIEKDHESKMEPLERGERGKEEMYIEELRAHTTGEKEEAPSHSDVNGLSPSPPRQPTLSIMLPSPQRGGTRPNNRRSPTDPSSFCNPLPDFYTPATTPLRPPATVYTNTFAPPPKNENDPPYYPYPDVYPKTLVSVLLLLFKHLHKNGEKFIKDLDRMTTVTRPFSFRPHLSFAALFLFYFFYYFVIAFVVADFISSKTVKAPRPVIVSNFSFSLTIIGHFLLLYPIVIDYIYEISVDIGSIIVVFLSDYFPIERANPPERATPPV